MGIKNLWQLLSPIGRSVSIETLSGKTLAVDVSIWLTQFIKAMRDDEGKVVKNAHIIGTLRRVVKLLFHRIRPVFVFDGGAPALKGRTLAARRKLRSEGTNASFRKTAQRILASQLKKHKVALNAAKRHADSAPTATFTPVYQSSDADLKASSEATTRVGSSTPVKSNDVSEEPTREVVGETSIEADGGSIGDTSTVENEGGKRKRESNNDASAKSVSRENEILATSKAFPVGRGIHEGGNGGNDDGDDDDDDVDWEDGGGIEAGGDEDGALRADREAPKNNDGGETLAETRGYGGGAENGTGRQGVAATNAEKSEEDAPWAVDTDDEEGEEDGDWEEVDLPEDDRDIDPEVIASLPDHMKKQVIEAAKRRQRMRSRAQYMPVAGDPALYSQTQLSNFLRGQKLNSQILRAHKQDDGEREGKKIASEAGRRYIMIPAAGSKGSGRTPTTGLASRKQGYASPSKDALKGQRRRIAGDDSDDFEEWSYDRSRSTASRKAHGSGGAGNAAPSVVVLENDEKKRTGGKRSIRVILEDDEEEAGGFLPQKPERGDNDSVLATSGQGKGSGGKLSLGAGGRAATEGAGKGKGKSKVRAHGGDDGEESCIDGEENEGVEESKRSGCAPSSTKTTAVGKGSPFRFEPGAADEVIARGLQEEEDRRAAMALRDEDEIPSAGGVANERPAVLTVAFAPGADGSRGNNSGLTSNTSDIASTGGWRNQGLSALHPPEHSELGHHEATRSPGEVTSVVHVRPEPEEVEIELEIDPSSLAGGSSRSEFWDLVGSDSAEAGARTGRQAKRNGCSDGGGRGGFFDDFEGHGAAPPQGQPSRTVPTDVALKRSVGMASRMAGWAGRVVERVLKEHHRQAGDGAAAMSSTGPARHIIRPSIPGGSSSSGGNGGGRGRRIASREGAVSAEITAASDPAPPETGTKEFSKIAVEAVDGEHCLSLLSDERKKLGFREGQSVPQGTMFVETGGVEGDSEGFHAAEAGSGSVRHRDMADVKERLTRKEADRRRVEVGTVTRVSQPGRCDGVVSTGECDRSEKLICTEKVEPEAKPSDEIQRNVAAKAVAAAGFLVEDTFSTRNPSRESPRAERAVKTSTDRSTPKIRGEETPEDHGALAWTNGVSTPEKCGSDQGDKTPGNFASAEVAEAALDGVGDVSDYSRGERDPDPLRRADVASLLPGGMRGKEPSPLVGDTSKVRSGLVEGDVSDGGRETPAAVVRSEGEEWPDSDDHYAAAHDGIGEGRQGGVPGFGVGSIGAGGNLDVGDVSRLMDMDEEELGAESERMRREGNKAQRDAETVTDEMKEEVMDLLKLFGVPYVIAPMEAEAQCCELERLKLVDGTVTDDSDAFAFGGKVVYKNIFSDRKFVEAYVLPDLEKDLGIGTDEVVALAMLLGSDYTEGVRGVGIVNAMEIINAFPLEGRGPYHGLSKFKEWIEGFDPVLDQELESLLKRGSSKEMESLSLEMKFHLKHRSARNRWTVSEGFPSKEVINAYKNPQVDKSEEPFSWATPDVDGLRALCKRVLGWEKRQSDGLLMPMVKELGRGTFSQPRIDRYFMTYHDNRRVAAIKSKRLRSAVEDLASGSTEVMTIKGSAAAAEIKGRKNIGQRHKSDCSLADIGADKAVSPASAKPVKASLKDAPSGRKARQSARVVLSEEDVDDSADARVPCEDASPKGKRPRPSPAESVAIGESNGSFHSSRSSRRTRGVGSLAGGSASARPGRKQKNSESSRPSSTKLAEGIRLNPRRKAATFRGGGGAGVVIGDEADRSGEDGDSSDDREDGDYEVSGESSDSGKELGAPCTERRPFEEAFGRRKSKRGKHVV